jgi:hypothetical protein
MRDIDGVMRQFNYGNRMQVPEVKKVVINMGLGEAVGNVKVIDAAVRSGMGVVAMKVMAHGKKDLKPGSFLWRVTILNLPAALSQALMSGSTIPSVRSKQVEQAA